VKNNSACEASIQEESKEPAGCPRYGNDSFAGDRAQGLRRTRLLRGLKRWAALCQARREGTACRALLSTSERVKRADQRILLRNLVRVWAARDDGFSRHWVEGCGDVFVDYAPGGLVALVADGDADPACGCGFACVGIDEAGEAVRKG
jgi:hypothetical protein